RLRDLGRPVLIGTRSVEKSEKLSEMLHAIGVEHQVLNARQHEQEAKVVEQAGQRGRGTIATNMAGRGTGIKLGPGVAPAGRPPPPGTARPPPPPTHPPPPRPARPPAAPPGRQ